MPDEKAIKKKKAAVSKELKRLTAICADFPENRKALAVGLIENIAFQRVELQRLRDFIAVNGWTELFSQSEKQEPYTRLRPESDIFTKILSQYAKNIKTLNDMSPSPIIKRVTQGDDFDEFVESRDRI